MKTKKQYTASEITQRALQILSLNGFEVWRNNNLAVRGRKFIGKRGAADITGYEKKTGKRVECEVKAGKDVLSKDQQEFLSDVALNGGYAIVATQKDDKIVLEYYEGVQNKKLVQ